MDDDCNSGNDSSTAIKVANGNYEKGAVNGISDGNRHHQKSEHRDKHRDGDRRSDKDKEKHRHSHSHKDKHRDKEHRSSSSHSKSKDRDRERDKDKDREREKDKDREREKDKDREREKDKDREREKDKDRDREREKDKDRSKDRHSSSKRDDKEKSSHREKDDKERHSSSKSKDKDKDREKSKSHSSSHRESLKEEYKPQESYNEVKVEIKVERMDIKMEEDTADDESMDERQLRVDSEEETPVQIKREVESDDDEDVPIFARVKKMKPSSDSEEESYKPEKKKKRKHSSDGDDFKPAKKKSSTKSPKTIKTENPSPKKAKKEKEEEQQVWKWWEEEKKDDGTKWKFLEHKGPLFAPEYEPLPSNVKFYYDGKEMKLSTDAEEVATFYAKMLTHDYTTKEVFNSNFFKDWRKTMTEKERSIIKDLRKCNFKDMNKYFTEKSEERKAMSKEEKKAIKEQNEAIQKEYGFCKIDGHVEKIGNFRIEPPGLFRGRGEHPKMGMHKHRVRPEDVIINCSKDSVFPKAPPGRKWRKVQHDPSVTWLASWTENVQGNVKYVMLNPSSKLKGEKDMMKYETARLLAKKIDKIRNVYQEDWKSKEMRIRQRAVALYFIDRLALRAGNEKDDDQADTVGCCSLRVEHVSLKDTLNGKECVVVFDFPGKDSIRYYNEVPVHKRVFKNLKLFMENKKPGDDLFDRLNTTVLNKHLNELMEGLTAKVFRTYNASHTLQMQLNELTNPDDTLPEKILAYNRANRAVAILCNHQRSVPKSHEKSMENLKAKIEAKREAIDEVKEELKKAKKSGDSNAAEKAKNKLARFKEQLMKLELQETDREENKTIALGTSKLNYLDPRISVAWCKKFDVPIEKIYNKTQRDKFRWAIDMAGPDYVF